MVSSISFLKLSEEWLDLKRLSVKYSTYIKYRNIVDLYLNEFFKEKELEACNEREMCSLFEELMKNKGLSSSSLKSISFVLKNIWEYGEKSYELQHWNTSYIKIPGKKQQISVLSDQEEDKVAAYCQKYCNRTTVAIYLSLYTGLRLGEICGLKWKDVDMERGFIHISRTVLRIKAHTADAKTSKMVLEPKTQSSRRTVVMTTFLAEYLLRYRHLKKEERHEEFYLLSNSLNVPEPRNIQRSFKTVCNRLNIQINFHSLRHTFATNCVKYGIDIKAVSELLGHSNITTTLNLYVHPSLEYKREQINKFFHQTVVD